MSSNRYEISFLLDDELHQYQFEGSQEAADEIRRALESDMEPVDIMRKGDLQVYLVGDMDPGGALELLDTIVSETFLDEEDEGELAPIRALAEAIDQGAGKAPGQSEAYLAEFIWDNGGGDDNPFSQAYLVHPGNREDAARFNDLLENLLSDHNIAYDFTCAPADGKHALLTLSDAIEATQSALNAATIASPRLDALRQAYTLDATVPVATAKPARRSI